MFTKLIMTISILFLSVSIFAQSSPTNAKKLKAKATDSSVLKSKNLIFENSKNDNYVLIMSKSDWQNLLECLDASTLPHNEVSTYYKYVLSNLRHQQVVVEPKSDSATKK